MLPGGRGAVNEKQIAWLVCLVGLAFGLLTVVGSILFKFQFRNDLAANIITESGSIAITVVVIAVLNQWREPGMTIKMLMADYCLPKSSVYRYLGHSILEHQVEHR
jgi:hypothetical protein